jgi:hypothetical protein|tara:strand:+ start:15 stop:494 length:480 start_codon:yes stop_codon:yes gene_type:complete
MFDNTIRPENSTVSTEKQKEYARNYAARRRAEKNALKLATGEFLPQESTGPKKNTNPAGRTKSIVNRVTEYGALFNQLNEARMSKGLPQLKTAMEVLIEAMQSDEIELKDKAKIAEKLANFESSRAPIISIEHVQNISKEEEVSADDALDDFLQSLRKV